MVVALHHHELVRGHPLLGDIPGAVARVLLAADADAFALADGVEREADVFANAFPFTGNNRARLAFQIPVQKIPERPLADEADTRRILLRVVRQAGLLRDSPHLGLLQLADPEHDALEL